MVDTPPNDDALAGPSTSALAHAEIVDLATSIEPYQQVPAHLRPRSALPGQELLRVLGPEFVCRLVQELESIYARGASTHIDLRIHTNRGLPHRIDFVPVQAYAMHRPTFVEPERR